MMHRPHIWAWIWVLLFGIPAVSTAQNLVIDPGFENHVSCPNGPDQLYRLVDWTRTTDGSSDYFNVCGSGSMQAPNTAFGYADPFDGDAYTGVVTWASSASNPLMQDYREYVTGRLAESMEAGRFYRAGFQTHLSSNYRYATDGLGMYLADTIMPWVTGSGQPTLSDAPWNYFPQVLQEGSALDSTAQWITIADTFIAAGGERNLVIGAFLNDADQVRADLAPWNSALSYYFLDGVFVERVYYPPLAVSDTVEAVLMTTVFADVLSNDSDFDGGLEVDSLRILAGPLFGTATIVPGTGEIAYEGDIGFLGSDTLSYRICDDEGLCDTAQVVFRVSGNLETPLALDDSASTAWREPIVLAILSNDLAGTYPLDPAAVLIWGIGVDTGSIAWTSSTQQLVFTPAADFCGTAHFAYTVCDDLGNCDTADVAVSVLCPATVCRTDDATLSGGDSTATNPLSNDSPGSGQWDLSSMQILTEPDAGTWFWRNNELVFEAPMHTSVQTLRYRACDEAGQCDEAEIIFRVTVNPVVDPPTTLNVPDVITPNGDGFNDRWIIPDLVAFQEHEVRIINRWDSEVYHSRSYNHDWDGARLPDGTYFYLIRVVDKNGKTAFYSGDLTLLR